MIVLIIESAPPSLRGELSKWMLEPKAGVYVGSLSGAVRDLLWDKACARVREGGCIMIYPAANEQGFAIRSWGDTTRVVDQWEGLFLVRRLPRASTATIEQAPLVMRLWAKANPFQPLPCHLVDVGFTALELLKTNAFKIAKQKLQEAMACPEELFDAWLGYIVALHDWGKGWPNFQGRSSGPDEIRQSLERAGLPLHVAEQEKTIRHEAISRLWLQRHLREWAEWGRSSAVTVGLATAAHHGRLGQGMPKLLSFTGDDQWESLRIETEEMVRAVFDPQPWQANFRDHSTAGMLLSGLIVWADWIASNEQLFPLRWNGEDWLGYAELSGLAAQHAVQKLGLDGKNSWQHIRSFTDAWPDFKEPRSIQTTMQDLVDDELEPGLVFIESPMGEGKSEAALYLATRLMQAGGGLYVALPTAATSNQMFDRVRSFLAEHDAGAAASVQLVHGASWLVDTLSPTEFIETFDDEDPGSSLAMDWFRPRKRSLLASYGVGTIDQALMSVMHVKHGFLRLFGLTGKVLIVDEVHAYDAYMSEILTLLLQWARLLSIRVILLSATLPRARRDALLKAYHDDALPPSGEAAGNLPYPLVTMAFTDGRVEERAVPPGDRAVAIKVQLHEGLLGDPKAIAKLALERLGDEGCLCVIVNTVGSAQAIYAELKQTAPDVDVLLFHSRFLAEHRHHIERAALDRFDKRSLLPSHEPEATVRPKRAILVATQVVEQSLDLDFDEMISEVAPIDLLLQRSGRLHRHTRPDRPRTKPLFHVLLPDADSDDFGSTGHVYAPYILLRTRLTLSGDWSLPQDMRALVEAVYGPEPNDVQPDLRDALSVARAKWEAFQEKMGDGARQYLIPKPYQRAFNLDRNARTVFEDDDGLQSYLSAKTRYGNYTAQTLLVEADEWAELAEGGRPPRRVLQALMLRTVALPRWWLQNVEAADGYEAPFFAPRWLSVEQVLCVKGGRWCGQDAKNNRIEIEISRELGVQFFNGKGLTDV